MLKSLSLRSAVSVVLVLVALGIGVAGFGFLASMRQPPEPREIEDNPLNVEVYRVESFPLQEYLEAFGTARADREVVVSAEVSGKIVEVLPNLKVGESVTAIPYPQKLTSDETIPAVVPDLLVQIEKFGYEKRRDSAEARYIEAHAEEDKIEKEIPSIKRQKDLAVRDYATYLAEYQRRKDLVAKGVGSKADLSNYERNLNTYKKNKEQLENQFNQLADRKIQVEAKARGLKAEWELARQDVEKTSVLPPFDGYLSEVFVELGQYVRTGDPLVRITDLSHVEIPVSLTSRQLNKLKPALDRGEIPIASLSENRESEVLWTGKLVRVSPEADERTRTIQAFIVVNNKTQEVPLLPGTFVFARIEGPEYKRNELFAVPRDAIFQDGVFVDESGIANHQTIEIVDTLQSFALVKSGLVHGDEIVLTNLDVLRDGDKIKKMSDQVRTLKTELEREGKSVRAIEIVEDQIASDLNGGDTP